MQEYLLQWVQWCYFDLNMKVRWNKKWQENSKRKMGMIFILIQTFSEYFPEHYSLALILSRTGIRVGEALALKWSDIDLTAVLLQFKLVSRGDRLKHQKWWKEKRWHVYATHRDALAFKAGTRKAVWWWYAGMGISKQCRKSYRKKLEVEGIFIRHLKYLKYGGYAFMTWGIHKKVFYCMPVSLWSTSKNCLDIAQ